MTDKKFEKVVDIEVPSFLIIENFMVYKDDEDKKYPCVEFQIGEEESEIMLFSDFLQLLDGVNAFTDLIMDAIEKIDKGD